MRTDADQSYLVALLKSCAKRKHLEEGFRLHVNVLSGGLLAKDTSVACILINMYAKCGALVKAQEVLDELPVRGLISWTAVITSYCQGGHAESALFCFEVMQHEGVSPDPATFACILKACSSIGAIAKGREIHDTIVRKGLLENDVVLGNALVDMYAKCGALVKAKHIFDELQIQDVISWTVLIAGYVQHGHGVEALDCFQQMQQNGLQPDAVTFACLLKACSSTGAAEKGQEIHAAVARDELLGRHGMLSSGLVDMYSKCGSLALSQQVFDELPARNVGSWTALMGGYALHGHAKEALSHFQMMQLEGFSPDSVTFICELIACSTMGAVEKGTELHNVIAKEGFTQKGNVLQNALVDMYSQCGSLSKALQVFDKIPIRDVVTWTSLIAGYTQIGKHDNVFDMFKMMISEGIQPSPVTYSVVLSACSSLGLLDESQMYFETMQTSYEIIPTLEHCTCMVDLFCRTGYFNRAMAMIEKMPSLCYLPSWLALLSACKRCGNMNIGQLTFKLVTSLDK